MENQVKERNVIKILKGLSKKVKIIIGIAIIVAICMFIVLVVNMKSDVDTTFLTQILTKSSELTTAKLKITGEIAVVLYVGHTRFFPINKALFTPL